MRHVATHQADNPAIGVLRRKRLMFVVQLILSSSLLAFIFHSIDLHEFGAIISSIDLRLFLLSVLLFFPAQLLAAFRWFFLLRNLDQPVSFRAVLRHSILGQFTTLFLPGQISGDVVRTISISRGKQDKALFVISVMLDKALLLAAIAALALFGLIVSSQLSRFSILILVSLGILAVSVIISILLTRYRPKNIHLNTVWLVRILPKIVQEKILSFEINLRAPRLSISLLCNMFILAIALQLLNSLGGFLLVQSFNMPIGIMDWIAISAIVSVAQVLPISISGLGIREGIFGSILALYGVSLAASTAFSLVGFVFSSILIAGSWLVSETLLKRGTNHE